jgi:hypothetical protein
MNRLHWRHLNSRYRLTGTSLDRQNYQSAASLLNPLLAQVLPDRPFPAVRVSPYLTLTLLKNILSKRFHRKP